MLDYTVINNRNSIRRTDAVLFVICNLYAEDAGFMMRVDLGLKSAADRY